MPGCGSSGSTGFCSTEDCSTGAGTGDFEEPLPFLPFPDFGLVLFLRDPFGETDFSGDFVLLGLFGLFDLSFPFLPFGDFFFPP